MIRIYGGVRGWGLVSPSYSIASKLGTIHFYEEKLASVLQVCLDSGAKRVLIPMSSAVDIPTVPPDLFSRFQISFYNSPEDCVFKALGVE